MDNAVLKVTFYLKKCFDFVSFKSLTIYLRLKDPDRGLMYERTLI